MSSRHIIKTNMALWFRVNINFYCTLKNDIALGASASCNIIFLSAIKIDIALTQVPYLYNIDIWGPTLKGKCTIRMTHVQIRHPPPPEPVLLQHSSVMAYRSEQVTSLRQPYGGIHLPKPHAGLWHRRSISCATSAQEPGEGGEGGGGTQLQRGAAPSLRISRKKGSFLKTSACPRFCKRRVLFCTQVRSMGVKIHLQSTKYTWLWRRVTPEASLLPPPCLPLNTQRIIKSKVKIRVPVHPMSVFW